MTRAESYVSLYPRPNDPFQRAMTWGSALRTRSAGKPPDRAAAPIRCANVGCGEKPKSEARKAMENPVKMLGFREQEVCMPQVDPWEKAADCERALRITVDPIRRETLSNIREFWIALAQESRFLSDAALAAQIETIGRLHAKFDREMHA
jgi:hypothetical protein